MFLAVLVFTVDLLPDGDPHQSEASLSLWNLKASAWSAGVALLLEVARRHLTNKTLLVINQNLQFALLLFGTRAIFPVIYGHDLLDTQVPEITTRLRSQIMMFFSVVAT